MYHLSNEQRCRWQLYRDKGLPEKMTDRYLVLACIGCNLAEFRMLQWRLTRMKRVTPTKFGNIYCHRYGAYLRG